MRTTLSGSVSQCISALLLAQSISVCSAPLNMSAGCQGQEKTLNISRTSCALIDICSNTHKSVPARATKWIWNECAGEGAGAGVGTVSAKCSHTSNAPLAAKLYEDLLRVDQIFCLSGHGKLVQTKRLPYANGILISQTESLLWP